MVGARDRGVNLTFRLTNDILLIDNKRKRVQDLIQLPKEDAKPKKRVVKSKITSWHLTSEENLSVIHEAHEQKVALEAKKAKKGTNS